MFQVTVKVTNPAQPERFFQERFWVDTGALYTFVPEDRLVSIALKPLRARELGLADGRRDRRLLGEALLTVAELGETLTCPIVFAPAGSLYLLGATAMEIFGVEADPTELVVQRTGAPVPTRKGQEIARNVEARTGSAP